MFLRAIAAFLVLPVMVAGVVPMLISLIPASRCWHSNWGGLPAILGAIILVSTVFSFYHRGKGTLAPWDPPKRLVVQDLYRFNRNPMYVGVLLIVAGWAIQSGDPWIYGYFLLLGLVFHLRVVLYEEREMERLFGTEWEAYKDAVPRWGWRF